MRRMFVFVFTVLFITTQTLAQLQTTQPPPPTANTSFSSSGLTPQQQQQIQTSLQNSQLTTQQQQQIQSALQNTQLTPQQQQQIQQAGTQIQQLVNNFLPQNGTMPQQNQQNGNTQISQQMSQIMQQFGGGLQIGDHGLDTQNFQANQFENKDQFNQFLNNLTSLANQLGTVNKSQIDAQAKLLQQQYDAQIQSQFNSTSNNLNSFKQQQYGNQSPPPQFQDFQNQLQQHQQNGDVQGLEEAQQRLQNAQEQAQNLNNNRNSAQQRLQTLQQNLQQLGQGGQGNPQQLIQQMQQFQGLQMPGEQFQQLCQNLSQNNVFNTTQNADQASQMLASLSQISSTQGNVDILAQTSTTDAQGVTEAQRCMDHSREQGQKRFAQFIGNGQSQFIESAGMFFQGFNPDNVTNNLTVGQNGQVQMNLPPGLMKKFQGLSNVVAQISQQNPGEWDGVSAIANFAKGMIVDIKFFAGNDTQNISGLSGSEQLNFCIPLTNSSTDCSTVKCSYIDPASSVLKFDGVSTSSAVSYVPGTNTPCCECTASHATSFTLVSSSAFSGKLMIMSLMGFLVAILALFFA